MTRSTDKRQRLVSAASERFHYAGVARASLNDIAKAADVPLGNVFYYFKTKDDLAKAVVDEWCEVQTGHLAELDADPDPWSRLMSFIRQADEMKDWYVAWGCPFAGLARDFRQTGGVLADEASKPYALQSQWIETQLRLTGLPDDDAGKHAKFILATIHGSILMGHAWSESDYITSNIEQLVGWLEALRQSRQA